MKTSEQACPALCTSKISQMNIIPFILQACQSCGHVFSEVETKHHCRACGRGVCGACSTNKKPVPERGWGEIPVRVCDRCFGKSPAIEEQPQAILNLR